MLTFSSTIASSPSREPCTVDNRSPKELVDDFLREDGKRSGKAACFSSTIRDVEKRPVRPEPMCFYQATSRDIHPDWKCTGKMDLNNIDVPTVSEVLQRKEKYTINRPMASNVDISRYPLLAGSTREFEQRRGDYTPFSHIRPTQFPAKAETLNYPPNARRGGDNPLYALTSENIGKIKPRPHQLSTYYYPKSNSFSKEFTISNPRVAGLTTVPTFSRVHNALNEYF